MEESIKQNSLIKDFIIISAVTLLAAAAYNAKDYHYLPTTTDDGVVSSKDSIPTLVIPDIR